MAKTNVEVIITGKDKATGVFKGIGNAARGLGMAMTAVGVAAIGMGVASVKSFAAAGDEVQKMSMRTGFSTEALSELKHAAELSGGSLGNLETGFKKMARFVDDAKTGLSTATDVMETMGITVADLAGLRPEEAFDKLTASLAAMEDPLAQQNAALELFGRSGTDLLPMLSRGAAGLREMREEAHELGLVFDQEAADSAAEFNDAMTRLTGSFNAIKFALAKEVTPGLTAFAGKLKDALTSVVTFAKENEELFKIMVTLTLGIGGLMAVVGPLLIALPNLVKGFAMAKVAAIGLTGSLTAMVAATAALVAGVGMIVWAFSQLSRNRQVRETTDELNALRIAISEATDPEEIKRLQEAFADLYTEATGKGLVLATKGLDEWVAAVKSGTPEAEELAAGLGVLTTAQNEARIAANRHKEALLALTFAGNAFGALFPGGMTEAEARLWGPEITAASEDFRASRGEAKAGDPSGIGRERTEREGSFEIQVNIDGMSLDQVLGELVLRRQRTGG